MKISPRWILISRQEKQNYKAKEDEAKEDFME